MQWLKRKCKTSLTFTLKKEHASFKSSSLHSISARRPVITHFLGADIIMAGMQRSDRYRADWLNETLNRLLSLVKQQKTLRLQIRAFKCNTALHNVNKECMNIIKTHVTASSLLCKHLAYFLTCGVAFGCVISPRISPRRVCVVWTLLSYAVGWMDRAARQPGMSERPWWGNGSLSFCRCYWGFAFPL